jgi:hypothetical protein
MKADGQIVLFLGRREISVRVITPSFCKNMIKFFPVLAFMASGTKRDQVFGAIIAEAATRLLMMDL